MNRLTIRAIIALVCLAAQGATAQISRWDFSLSSGASFPTKPFAKYTVNSIDSYANTGWNAEARATYRLWKNWGVTALTGYQQNKLDVQGAGGVDFSPFTAVRLMAGPSYHLPLGRGWALTAGFLVGAQRSDLKFKYTEAAPFTWEPNLGLQYSLGKHWYVQADFDYPYSVSHGPLTYGTNGLPDVYVYDFYRRLVNANLGLGFRL